MKSEVQNLPIRIWLKINGYADILAMIDKVIADLLKRKSKERRNWWDILSGNKFGGSRYVNGVKFPVLKAAQLRQGKEITPNAISRNDKEDAPKILPTNRWPKSRKRK